MNSWPLRRDNGPMRDACGGRCQSSPTMRRRIGATRLYGYCPAMSRINFAGMLARCDGGGTSASVMTVDVMMTADVTKSRVTGSCT